MLCNALLQDVSSIGCYLWDITLLYAQQQDNGELAKLLARLQVGLASAFWKKKMLKSDVRLQNPSNSLNKTKDFVCVSPPASSMCADSAPPPFIPVIHSPV